MARTPADARAAARSEPTPDQAAWDGPTCNGATQPTLCSWTSPDRTLALEIATGRPTVVDADLRPPPSGVAVWPFMTAQEAAATQRGVDNGHSPWQLEPEAVAISYAENVLGLSEPQVEPTTPDPVTLRVTSQRPA